MNRFYDNLNAVLEKKPELGDGLRIYNLDETGLSTVQTPQKVLADSTTRRLNKVTSAERGQLVTACCIISSSGTYLPPVMVFPRHNFKPWMLKGAPNGTLGLANPSGWMTSDIFPEVLKHFIKHSNTTPDNPSLLVFDNHESHMGPDTIRMAKDNGVYLVTLPPHCSDKMQPLDVAVYRSLKGSYNSEADKWLSNHPGKTITIYDVAEIFGIAFYRSMTPSNITSGFKATGIYPFNRDVFSEELYLCSLVTDRKEEEVAEADKNKPITVENEPSNGSPEAQPANTNENSSPNEIIESDAELETPGSGNSAVDLFGLPKAGPRKTKGGRKRGKSTILTDSPVLQEIEQKAAEKAAMLGKKKLNFESERVPKKRKITNNNRKKKLPKKRRIADKNDQTEISNLEQTELQKLSLVVSDFCLVKFVTEEDEQTKFYIGQIVQLHHKAYELSFLRRISKNRLVFSFPQEPDVATVSENDIIRQVLPIERAATARQNRQLCFDFAEPPNLY